MTALAAITRRYRRDPSRGEVEIASSRRACINRSSGIDAFSDRQRDMTGDWAVEAAETPFPLISPYYARMFCLLSSCSARGDFSAID